MKRFIFISVAIFSFAIMSFAQNAQSSKPKRSVGLEFHTSNNPDRLHRTLLWYDVEVIYDSSDSSIEVISDDFFMGEVYLIDNSNNCVVDYSPSLNVTLSVPANTGSYTIRLVCDYWSAVGTLNL